jgi:hypothetical protein
MADDRIAILDPGRREARELTVPSGINIVAASSQGLIWTADGAGILGARSRGERFDAGVISAEDGSFEVTTRSVPTYQATGLGRAFGADGSTLGWACDDGVGPGATGCFIDRISVDGTRTMWYPDTLGPPAPLDALFTADGVDVWMILPPEAGDPLVARFPEPNQYTIVGEAPRVGPDVPTFTGISDDDSILVSDPGDVRTMLLRPDSGEAVEVDGVFAGWEAGGTYP